MAKRKKDAPPPVESFGDGIVAVNRRATFDYELGQKYEAGIMLVGSEVKMLREATADLTEAYVSVDRRGEAWVHGLNIPERTGSAWGHKAKRTRKLLLNRHEIDQIKRATERDGMTVVSTRLYFRAGRAKLEIALAKGKAKIDKRQTIKAREADREARAAMDRGMRGGDR